MAKRNKKITKKKVTEQPQAASRKEIEENLEGLIKVYVAIAEKNGAVIDKLTTSSLKRVNKAVGYYPLPPGEGDYFKMSSEKEAYDLSCQLKDLYVEFSKHADALELLKEKENKNED